MPDWASIVSACAAVAGVAFGLFQYFARIRTDKRFVGVPEITEVITAREDKVLFKTNHPDVQLRPLAESAKQWRQLCSTAKATTTEGSPRRVALQECLDAATLFEGQLGEMLKRHDVHDPEAYAFDDQKTELDNFRAQLRAATKDPVARLAASLPRPRGRRRT